MPAITQFNDFMASTGPAYLKSADQVIMEAVKNNYILSRLLKEKASETLIQSGSSIRNVIIFDDASTYQKYAPNEVFSWRNPQVTDTISASWRFSMDYMSWTDQEVELNEGDAKTMYKRLKRIKEQRMWTSMLNGFENDLWASPFGNESNMETASGKEPYSIPALITESVNSDISLGERGGAPFNTAAARWSTLQGINPTAGNDPRWSNQITFYNRKLNITDAPVDRAAGAYGNYNANTNIGRTVFPLFGAFDDMYLKVQFKSPLTQRQYFEETDFNRQMILASKDGINQYKRALRLSNDSLVSMQDGAYNTPTYSGIPVEYCANLDTAAVYAAASSAIADDEASRDGATFSTVNTEFHPNTIDKGPRYYFLNAAYISPVFHTTRYMKKHDVMRHPNQPFSWVQPVDCWWNLFCHSRQRHGIITPIVTA